MATTAPSQSSSAEGKVDFSPPSAGKLCKTWYKVLGDIKVGAPALIALHGGPGVSSEYLAILSDVTINLGFPLIIYDQIGSGLSTHLPEKMGDASFWTEELFLHELDNLLSHLGIASYYLLGHSWGAMLAARHAIKQPLGLKKLVLASGLADMGMWVEAANKLRAQLPADVQAVLDMHEAAETTDSAEYEEAVGVFYARHVCVLDPMPQEVLAALEWIKKDPTVYMTMLGPSEFYVTGTLKNWSIINELHKISVPTLLTNGAFDEATDAVVTPLFKGIPKVKWVTFAKSSHMAHFEERQRFMDVVCEFLKT